MLYDYSNSIKKFNNHYNLNKAIEKGQIYKIDRGIYSDNKNVSELDIISFKYSNAIFTKDSAYFYLGFTNYAPDKYYLATPKDAYKIKDKRIIQIFCKNNQFNFGTTEIIYENTKIKVYNKERMLVELVRNKNKCPYDYYKEIINNYRNIKNELNISNIINYAKYYANSNNIIKTLQLEVF